MSAPLIYLDNAATTRLDPRVAASMRTAAEEAWGNPSSLHTAGRRGRAAVDAARGQVAELLGASPEEIVFTSGGSEADNLALLGIMRPSLGHLIVSAFEHPAVLETARALQAEGVELDLLPVSPEGIVDPEDLGRRLRPGTRLVSVMTANNVVGTVQPIAELSRLAHEHGALFHTDAVQAAGHSPIDVHRLGIDLLSLSGHKFHGPQGTGALFVRQGLRLAPMMHGGGQEGGRRSGTENVAALVGLGRAAEIARLEMRDEAVRLVALRDRLIEEIPSRIASAYLIGDRHRRLPGHACFGFRGQEGEAIRLLLALDEAGVAVSSGSACSAHHSGQPSYVLAAMGFDPIAARGSLRITLGRFNTEAEVDRFLEILPGAVSDLRSITTRA